MNLNCVSLQRVCFLFIVIGCGATNGIPVRQGSDQSAFVEQIPLVVLDQPQVEGSQGIWAGAYSPFYSNDEEPPAYSPHGYEAPPFALSQDEDMSSSLQTQYRGYDRLLAQSQSSSLPGPSASDPVVNMKDEIKGRLERAEETWSSIMLPGILEEAKPRLLTSSKVLDVLYKTLGSSRTETIHELRKTASNYITSCHASKSIKIWSFLINSVNLYLPEPENRQTLCQGGGFFYRALGFLQRFCDTGVSAGIDIEIGSSPEYAALVLGALKRDLKQIIMEDEDREFLATQYHELNQLLETLMHAAENAQFGLSEMLDNAEPFLLSDMSPFKWELEDEPLSPFFSSGQAGSSSVAEKIKFALTFLERKMEEEISSLRRLIDKVIAIGLLYSVTEDWTLSPVIRSIYLDNEFWTLNSGALTLTPSSSSVNTQFASESEFNHKTRALISRLFANSPAFEDWFLETYLQLDAQRDLFERSVIVPILRCQMVNEQQIQVDAMKIFRLHFNELVPQALGHSYIIARLESHFTNHYMTALPRAFGKPFGTDYFTLVDIEEIRRFYMHLVTFVSFSL